MQTKEEKICSFTQKGIRLQLVKIIYYDLSDPKKYIKGVPANKYEVRLNRKIIKRSISKYEMQKIFATYTQNIVLQLEIY